MQDLKGISSAANYCLILALGNFHFTLHREENLLQTEVIALPLLPTQSYEERWLPTTESIHSNAIGHDLSLHVLFSMENIQFQLAQTPEVKNSGYSHMIDFSIGFLEANVLLSTARWAGMEDKCPKWAV